MTPPLQSFRNANDARAASGAIEHDHHGQLGQSATTEIIESFHAEKYVLKVKPSNERIVLSRDQMLSLRSQRRDSFLVEVITSDAAIVERPRHWSRRYVRAGSVHAASQFESGPPHRKATLLTDAGQNMRESDNRADEVRHTMPFDQSTRRKPVQPRIA